MALKFNKTIMHRYWPQSEDCPATLFFDSPECSLDIGRDTELVKLLMKKAWSPHRPDSG